MGSIVTRTGDAGTTGLMYNRRVPKSHPRVEAYGGVDELNAALGMARASTGDPFLGGSLLAIQKHLVVVMGELATGVEDLERYVRDGFQLVTAAQVAVLDDLVTALEARKISFSGWATPGANPSAATLDLARTICRRAERRVVALHEAGDLRNAEILVFLNRLSDLLWLMARWAESPREGGEPTM
ncbi:MAG: cob(I)yrinic acid a,c-diamide adenosyltransferase [Verrucomicrobia bacterium]|nr:cob(I)yrinic acid a,c-diamide adenosyltransferase [Verrucomicrobiota bacterium]